MGVTYDVEIYQKDYAGAVSMVAFCEDPLEIEWQEVDKLEPVASSAATLCLFAERDRQFTDLYTVEAGSIRMDVYRDGALHWSGTLDTELYEEPFAYWKIHSYLPPSVHFKVIPPIHSKVTP